MGIVDDLLAQPGTYVGVDSHRHHAAKIVVAPLPGGGGVSLDYETFAADHEPVLAHAEHAVVGRTAGGDAILVSGHSHADTVAVLREREPGVFVTAGEPSAFPMAIRIEVPESGRLVHAWSYGRPGEEPEERDRAELTRLA
jgi:hypothetical protein